MTFVMRTHVEPLTLVGAVRAAVWEVNPDQPITQIATMEQVVHDSVAQPRFAMLLLVVFAGLALVLAAVGIYGVIAYTVSRQTHEIGIRMALGAGSGGVIRLVVGRSMIMAAIGVGLGLLAAAWLTQFMASLLYQVTSVDPATFVAVALLFSAVALGASVVPALKAIRIDPLTALRCE
jgi:putative ABC transport system permease protein